MLHILIPTHTEHEGRYYLGNVGVYGRILLKWLILIVSLPYPASEEDFLQELFPPKFITNYLYPPCHSPRFHYINSTHAI
jgi:hypothetical protein